MADHPGEATVLNGVGATQAGKGIHVNAALGYSLA
jgi:hypothetical protein